MTSLQEQLDALRENLTAAQSTLVGVLEELERGEISHGKKVKKGFDKVLSDYSRKSKQLKLAEQKKGLTPEKLQQAQAEVISAQHTFSHIALNTKQSLEYLNQLSFGVTTRELRNFLAASEACARTTRRLSTRALAQMPAVQINTVPPPPLSATPQSGSRISAAAEDDARPVASASTASPADSPVPTRSFSQPPAAQPHQQQLQPADVASSSSPYGIVGMPSLAPSPAPSSSPSSSPVASSPLVPSSTPIRSTSTAALDDARLLLLKDFLPVQLDYLETLRSGVHHTMVTFASEESLSSRVFSEDRSTLFGNLPELLTHAQSLYEELERCCRTWPESQPGQLFSRLQWTAVFSPYLENYPRSICLIDRCSKASKQFHSWANTANASTLRNLYDLLGLPLTMLRHYESLIESLNLSTATGHADHLPLVAVYTDLSALATQAMLAEQQTKNLRDLWHLTERMRGSNELNLMADASRAVLYETSVLLFEDPVMRGKSWQDDDEGEQIRLIVLSDMLVEATQKRKLSGKKITCKRTISLDLANFEDKHNSLAFQIRLDDEQGLVYSYAALNGIDKAALASAILAALKKLHRNRVFGIPLDQLMALPRERFNDIPSLVQKAIDEVVARGLNVEGIFRLSGSASQIRKIRKRMDSGEDVSFKPDSNPECLDIHVVAGTLKLWIRSLPEPLMLNGPNDSFISLAQQIIADPPIPTDALVQRAKMLVHSLPTYHRFLLHHLVSFFELISGFADANKMNPHNIAIVFAPNLIGGPSGIMDPSLHKCIFALVEFMVEYCDDIFQEVSVQRRLMKEGFLREQQELVQQAPASSTTISASS